MERLMLWRTWNKNPTPKLNVVDVVFVDDDDLSSWEIIDPSSHEETHDDERPESVQEEHSPEGNDATVVVVPVLSGKKSDDPILTDHDTWSGVVGDVIRRDDQVRQRCGLDEYDGWSRSTDDDYDDDDDDDVDYSYDDDRFGYQRMGKVGKKVNRGMMKKSKRLPRYFYNKMA